MAIALRQSASNTDRAGKFRSVSVNFVSPTQPKSLLFLVATTTHPADNTAVLANDPPGFVRVFTRREYKLSMAVWQYTGAPSMSKVTVASNGETYGLQVRLLEFTGIAQSGAIDKITVRGYNPESGGAAQAPNTGATGTLSQAEELLVGVVVNQYGSTTQSGFTGGLARLYESLSSSNEPDHDRTRLTVHGAVTTTAGSYALGARLSTSRAWIGALISFRSGTSGPARMSSTQQPSAITIGGRGELTAFGPLVSRAQPPAITIGGRGWVGPFEHQFLLGGKLGLLIGAGTDYRVESVEGLGGWDVRQSDVEFPRGDGAQRGIDLQSARQVLFRVNFDGPPALLESAMQRLLTALVPQRDTDWDLYFRLPGLPLQTIRCRPMALTRELSAQQLILANQAFALRAADPRIYSARSREVVIPVTPDGLGSAVTAASVINAGNANAYPIIRVRGASSEVTRIELVNATGDVSFEVEAVLPANGQLVGDMPARIAAEPRDVITIDGQSKYGAWVSPREAFFLAPGVNAVYLRTTPPGADVTAVLDYRDTWSG